MKALAVKTHSAIFFGILACAVLAIPRVVQAQVNWRATVGGESSDMGKQALAFFPMKFGFTLATASLGRGRAT